MLFNKESLVVSPELKTVDWARRVMRNYFQNWRPIVDPDRYAKNMALVQSRYNMDKYKNMFKDPDNIGFDFVPIAVMEKIRNVLFGERLDAGITATASATDPASENERKADKTMLETRKEFETLMTELSTSIGLPEYKLDNERKAGNKVFNGNAEAFDELGLNEQSKRDINYFFKIHHKLLHEMDATEIANAYLSYNKTEENIEHWCNDAMAVKAIGGQVYVDQVSGAMKYAYFPADRIFHIPGNTNNHRDSSCVGFEDNVTVAEVIRRMGNEFDFDLHINLLVDSVNFHHKYNIVRVTYEGSPIWQINNDIEGQECSWDEFSQYKVGIGYMEFRTIDAATYKVGKDFAGNTQNYRISNDTPVEENTPYVREVRHRFTTYKSYFFSTSTADLVPFNFGKLYHQTLEGAEDEISNYSIFYKVLTGLSVAEVAAPWISIAVELFYKLKWIIRKAKPKGRSYNYESLVKMAKHLIKEGDLKTKVTQLIKMFEEGVNEIYTLPEVNGERMGGGQQVHYDKPNGLDESVVNFKSLIEWCFNMIESDNGMNDARTAETMAPNSGFKLQMNQMRQSTKATKWFDALIDWHVAEISTRFVITAQDIIRYKSSAPYKFLCYQVGENVADRLAMLENVCMHRYSIFVYTLSTYNERQEIKAQTYDAYQKGQIPFEVMILINEEKDYKKAAFILSYEKKRAEEKEFLLEQQRHNNVIAEEQNKHALEMQRIMAEYEGQAKVKKVEGYFDVLVATKNNEAKENIVQMKHQDKPQELEKKTEEQTKLAANKATIDSQHQV